MTRIRGAVSVFHFKEYKSCIRAYVVEAEQHSKGVRATLARSIACQSAYLSRVLNGDADFSLEQAQAVAKFFVLSPSETAYLLAMVGENRAGTVDLKEYWRKQMKTARLQHADLGERLELTDHLSGAMLIQYYGSWHYAAVHVAVSIPGFQTIAALSAYLGLKEDVVRKTLDFLIAGGLVRKERQLYVMTERNIHLSRNDSMIPQHHTNWKMKSIEALLTPESAQVHYTGVVSLSRADVQKMNELVQAAVERARNLVRSSSEEILGCYQFGFFEVGDRR